MQLQKVKFNPAGKQVCGPQECYYEMQSGGQKWL